MGQESDNLREQIERRLGRTIWPTAYAAMGVCAAILSYFTIFSQAIQGCQKTTSNSKSRNISLHFEKDGEVIKNVEVISPESFSNIQDDKNGFFKVEASDTLPDKIYIRYLVQGDSGIKEDEAFSTDSSNYIIYIK